MSSNTKQGITIVLSLTALAISVAVALVIGRPTTEVTNFEQCRKAGGMLLEIYPEQCMLKGMTFVNDKQTISDNEYIGLTEAEALDKAKQSNTPARVVERDSESLPVTMDFVFGRQNLYVKEGKVYKVDVEGQATDDTQQ